MAEQQTASEINIDKVVRYLNGAFAKATAGMGKALRANEKTKTPATDLYTLQVEFAHLIDNIQRGPKYFAPKVISECNEFIDSIWQKRESEPKGKAKPASKRA